MKRYKRSGFGKEIENNLIRSLQMAGAKLETSAELDHNHKIDFLLKFKNQDIGVQFSLCRDDIKKIRAAKICALDVVPRFIFLSIAKEFFDRPDKRNGKYLYHFLRTIAGKSMDRALAVNIDHGGWQVQPI